MTEHRKTARFDPENPDEIGPVRPRRLARLVSHPVAKRLSFPKLMIALVAVVAFVGLGIRVGTNFLRSATVYLHDHPTQQIPVSAVKLVPPPDPWIASGSTRLLQAVTEGDRVGVAGLDLDAVDKALRLCPWVKDVGTIHREHGSLMIPLTYYQPVAMALIDKGRIVIDRDGVILPAEDLAWKLQDGKPSRIPRGRDEPLIVLDGITTPEEPRVGSYWGQNNQVDPLVLRAARLAEFLTASEHADGPGSVQFKIIKPDIPPKSTPSRGLYAYTAEGTCVFWGWSPTVETPDTPTASQKWTILRDWIRLDGLPLIEPPNYISFDPKKGLVDAYKTLQPRVKSGR